MEHLLAASRALLSSTMVLAILAFPIHANRQTTVAPSSASVVPGSTGAGMLASGAASDCQPEWLPTFGDQPGLNGGFAALVVFDDGSGPALYAGGNFTLPEVGANFIARWDGSSWSPLGSGMSHSVSALEVFDDGGGPALYAGGTFSTAGGVVVDSIARWDGTNWSPLGSGMNVGGIVQALAIFDDGGGPALYAGGGFHSAGGVAANSIAKWDGSSWSALGGGMDSVIRALAVFDDGGGPALFAGGSFSAAGGVPANRVAKWDGSSWSPLKDGLSGSFFDAAHSLAVHDDGAGPALHVGGAFTVASGVPVNGIARWDGSSWSPLGSGVGGVSVPRVDALAVFDHGAGPALYAGGWFTVAGGVAANHIAMWDGSSWSPLGSGVAVDSPFATSAVLALAVHDDGGGPALHVGGAFTSSPAGDSRLAKWGCVGVGEPFCFGDGGACPCGNAGGAGEGCANSSGTGATIAGSGSASAAADDLSIDAANLGAGAPALLFAGADALNGGVGLPFGDGLRCVGGGVLRLGVRVSTGRGTASWGPGLAGQGGYGTGQIARFQVWYRDAVGSPCGSGFNLSHGLEVTFH